MKKLTLFYFLLISSFFALGLIPCIATAAVINLEEDFESEPMDKDVQLQSAGGGFYNTTSNAAYSGSKSLLLGIGQYQGGQNDSWSEAQFRFPAPMTEGVVELYLYIPPGSPFYVYPTLFTDTYGWDTGAYLWDNSNTIVPGWFQSLEVESSTQKVDGWLRFRWMISAGKVELWVGGTLIGRGPYKAAPEGVRVSMTSYFVSNVSMLLDKVSATTDISATEQLVKICVPTNTPVRLGIGLSDVTNVRAPILPYGWKFDAASAQIFGRMTGTNPMSALLTGERGTNPPISVPLELFPQLGQNIVFFVRPNATVGDAIRWRATSSSRLPVTITSSDPNIIMIDGSNATALGTGRVTLTATQDGNENFAPAKPVSRRVDVK